MEANRAAQLQFYAEQIDQETEITRPRGYPRPVQFLLEFKLRNVLELLGKGLAGRTALVVGAGSGMDSEYLARRGLRVIGTDISLQALSRAKERARRYGVDYALVAADAECLPFRTGSADFSFVHDCLHHLDRPDAALREMTRVTSRAIAVAEPAQSPLTRVAVRLGISSDWEDAGNYVRRLRAGELIAELAKLGFCRFRATQHLVYYQPWTFKIYRLLEDTVPFALFRGLFSISNWLVGRWGNSVKVVAWKPQEHRCE